MSVDLTLAAVPRHVLDAVLDHPDEMPALLFDPARATQLHDRLAVGTYWQALLYTLTGDAYSGAGPLAYALCGSALDSFDFFHPSGDALSYIPAMDVPTIASALTQLGPSAFLSRVDLLSLDRVDEISGIRWAEDTGEEQAALLALFMGLTTFYQQAAERADAVLVDLA
jgi:hypothetical protein